MWLILIIQRLCALLINVIPDNPSGSLKDKFADNASKKIAGYFPASIVLLILKILLFRLFSSAAFLLPVQQKRD